jgi:hypothetical protein
VEGDAPVTTRWLYEDFAQIIPVIEPRRIAANGGRAGAPCALITNDETLAEALRR